MAFTLCIILVLTMCACATGSRPLFGDIGITYPEIARQSLTSDTVAESDTLLLKFSTETASLSVLDKRSGLTYFTNPPGATEDTVAKGLNKQELVSQITVTYLDKEDRQQITNSGRACLPDGTWGYQTTADGIVITYSFEDLGFWIPVHYTIRGDVFAVSLIGSEIGQFSDNKIVSITVLPYFSAAGSEEEGYIFVPDGSGALIAFNTEKYTYQGYSQYIYGRDRTLNTLNVSEIKQDIKLPVFGMSLSEGGFLAVVSQGEAQGFISADIARKKTGYNTVYSGVRFIQVETERFFEATASAQDIQVNSQQMAPEVFEISYFFLNKYDNGYTDMACIYAAYLQEQGLIRSPLLNDGAYSINLDLYGAIRKQDTFIGIPYNAVCKLTTFKRASEMVRELMSKSITGVNVRYLGWNSGGLEGKFPVRVNHEGALGTRKDIVALRELLAETGGILALSSDFVNMHKGGNGVSIYFDTVKNISQAPAFQYWYLYSTGSRNKGIKPWYLATPLKASETACRFVKNVSSEGYDFIGVSGITDVIYSDFRRNAVSATETQVLFESALAVMSDYSGLWLENPNGYALPYGSAVMNVPVVSSGFDVELCSIPFYSIVLSGLTPCYSQPVNLQGDTRSYLLKCIEAGVLPSFALTGSDSGILADTPYNWLHSTDFDYWKTIIAEYTLRAYEDLAGTVGRRIIRHEVAGNVTVTGYEGDILVVVNHGATGVDYQGVFIAAKDYLVVGGANG